MNATDRATCPVYAAPVRVSGDYRLTGDERFVEVDASKVPATLTLPDRLEGEVVVDVVNPRNLVAVDGGEHLIRGDAKVYLSGTAPRVFYAGTTEWR